MADDITTQRIMGIHADSARAQRAAESSSISRIAISQESAAEEFQEWSELSAFNPLAIARRFESLETKIRKKPREDETEKTDKKDEQVAEVKRLEEVSEQFERRNPELHARSLLLLRARISKNDTPDEILKKVLEAYPDHSLADEALDFLMATSDRDLAEKIREVKEKFNEVYGREIRAGKNISIQAREFSKQGLGTPNALRDLYRDLTGNPRDPSTLFAELANNFTFEKMKTVIAFVLHALGSDLKSKGPSISRGELHRLVTEARSMQAILGVYRFFRSRMKLVQSAFEREGLTLPSRITFEILAKIFVKLIMERYPSSEKVLQMGIKWALPMRSLPK
jgi:type III secretion protein W